MNRRTTTVYITSGFILGMIFLSAYFFARKPQHAEQRQRESGKKVILFNDVKYSGEKKGVVDWEIRAKLMRKYIDTSVVEMEGIEGDYKPKPGTSVTFKGVSGRMDTEKEVGSVQHVEVYYKGEYVIKSPSMEFDFKKSLAWTAAPVEVEGKKFSMTGVGLSADTLDHIITLEKQVVGTIQEEKAHYAFTADRFTYLLSDNTYIFEGRVVVKGERMDMFCDKVKVLSTNEDMDRIDATGRVRIVSKGTIAKSERAVYYLKDDRVVLTDHPRIVRENVEMEGRTVVYNLSTDKFSVENPKMRIEQRSK